MLDTEHNRRHGVEESAGTGSYDSESRLLTYCNKLSLFGTPTKSLYELQRA
jgi:hypothetical protein